MEATPWYKVTDTNVTAEDAKCIYDYITSDGLFQDLMVLYMYVKQLMDQRTLNLFYKTLKKVL